MIDDVKPSAISMEQATGAHVGKRLRVFHPLSIIYSTVRRRIESAT